MLNVISKLALMAIFTCALAASQANGQDAVVFETGGAKKLKVEGLVGVSVGNVNIAYIQERRGDEFVVFGAKPGETSLLLTRRGGLKDMAMKLRVLPKGAVIPPEPRPVAAAAAAARPTSAPLRAEPTPLDTAAPLAAPESKAAAPPAVPESKYAGRSMDRARPRPTTSRLQVSFDSYFMTDTEQYPVVNAGHDGEHDHQHGAAATHGEHDHETGEQQVEFATVRRSVTVLPLSLRYQLSPRNSLTASVPFVRRVDEITVGKEKHKTLTQGLGDVQIGFERMYPRIRKSAWDGALDLSASLPTGRSIYSNKRGSPIGLGHFELGGRMSIRRVFDPLAVNATVGLHYTVPRTESGMRVSPGLGHTLQTGFAYALSDRWAFSEQLTYSRRPNIFLNGPSDMKVYKSDQSYLSHGLLFNPRNGGHVFRMSFNVGLTPTSTDRGFGVSYTFQRRSSVE